MLKIIQSGDNDTYPDDATKMVKICSDLNHPIDLRLQSHMRYFKNLKQFISIYSDNLTGIAENIKE
jgi:hypothetical protein